MYRALVFVLVVFLVPIIAAAQTVYTEGVTHVGTVVYCSSRKNAEDVAKAYLYRGNLKYIPRKYKHKFHVGTIAFIPVKTLVIYMTHQKAVFVIEAVSNKTIYIVSKIPTEPKR